MQPELNCDVIEMPIPLHAGTTCGAECPTCKKEGARGGCSLDVGHTQNHKCNRDSGHTWS